MTIIQLRNWLVKAGIAVPVLGFTALAGQAYYREYLFTRAELGRKTMTEYEVLLTDAWKANPYNGSAALRYAQLLQRQGHLGDSLRVLAGSSAGKTHWQGWELQGAAWEGIAFTEEGTLEQAERASKLYDRVLKVHPAYTRGLERRALLGLKLGQWELVESLAQRLQKINAGNRNVTYLRARVAEGVGDEKRAREFYTKLSAGGAPGSGALFTQAEVERRLVKEGDEARP